MGRAKKTTLLIDTEFWNARGKHLMRSRIDPRRISTESTLKVQVLCEGCGKPIRKRLNLWAKGKTRCRVCQNEYNQKNMPEAEAREPEAFGNGTLWGDFPWKIILSWDWTRNDKAPWELRSQSKHIIHLVCPECGCRYETTVRSCHRSWAGARKGTQSCPCCGFKVLMVGRNDVGTLYPEVAAHWHPTKNGELTPQDVMPNSRKRVWWVYEDGSEGQATIRNKIARGFAKRGTECSSPTSLPLSVTHPELCEQWDNDANQGLTPDMLTYGSKQYVCWRCPDCGYGWKAQIKSRTLSESGCPKCAKKGTSSGEDKTAQVLKQLGLAYDVNRRFPDCRYKAPLPFDFAVYDAVGSLRFLIEYQGRQHFFVVPMWGGEDGLAYRQKCDQIKRDYCKAKRIPELEIPYTVDTVEGIQGEVMQFILRQMPVGDVAASAVA